jgi:mannose-1-phosphate guanylyltransferase
VFPIECTWYETGNPQDFFAAQTECLTDILNKTSNGRYLEKVIETYSTEKIDYSKNGNALIAKSFSAHIDEKSILSGTVCIGKNAYIKANAKIENSTICANVTVSENSSYLNTIVLS